MDPAQVSRMMTRLVTKFDRLAHIHGVQKVDVFGDAYIAAANLTEAERRQIVEREADDQADKVRKAAADRKKLDALIGARAATALARMKARGI
jgi:hypothetical protein